LPVALDRAIEKDSLEFKNREFVRIDKPVNFPRTCSRRRETGSGMLWISSM